MTSLRIAVLIATLDRPLGLKALLGAIGRLRLEPWADDAVTIVVVDNSETASARAPCDEFAAGRFGLIYVHEPRRGLSFARNAALETAMQARATHVAFIDDDELPDPDWLCALLSTLERTGATAAIGSIRPVFERVPPPWCVESAAFTKTQDARATSLLDGYTCNSMVDLGFIADKHLRFALRYNLTGGEDTMFFRGLRASGGTIAWASAAIVHETIPVDRTSRRWLIRRWFRTGGTEADLASLGRPGEPRRFYNFMRGVVRIGWGFISLLVGLARHPVKPGTTLVALFTLCRGAGLIWSAVGSTYAEYGQAGKAPVSRW